MHQLTPPPSHPPPSLSNPLRSLTSTGCVGPTKFAGSACTTPRVLAAATEGLGTMTTRRPRRRVRAAVYVCVCVCMCEKEREREISLLFCLMSQCFDANPDHTLLSPPPPAHRDRDRVDVPAPKELVISWLLRASESSGCLGAALAAVQPAGPQRVHVPHAEQRHLD